ncbi:hypothetical protein EV356DRAFT_509520 [Viridothelium virens]|uniref:Uncharacterized protein n=1 Tax=Viridothelium virens TaxID=1048519 RepID=A0A6A6GWA3_VIRVR|nr:hypothetical protein EV356DRAFT_509520 [Viridothelium virens]
MVLRAQFQPRHFSTSSRVYTSLLGNMVSAPTHHGSRIVRRLSIAGVATALLGVGVMTISSKTSSWMTHKKRMAELDRKRWEENAKMADAYGDGSSLQDLENAVDAYSKR